MRSYTGAMRTNRTARHSSSDRPGTASMIVAAVAAAAVTILVTVAAVALACYLAGASSALAPRSGGAARARAVSTSPLIDPTTGRGADSATCKHAPRSPRCLREGGTAAVVRDRGLSRGVESGSDQTALLGGEGARPAEVPGRVPGRGGWVSELGPSQA